jgi:hypothetical protein
MIRKTWTNVPIVKLIRRPFNGSFKPIGLWYEIDGGWEEWCDDNQPNFLGKGYHVVTFTSESGILVLSKSEDILSFQEKYSDVRIGINWAKVAKDFDGIEIRDYSSMWGSRLDFNLTWFYGWDCSSGCIWNPDIVQLSEWLERDKL